MVECAAKSRTLYTKGMKMKTIKMVKALVALFAVAFAVPAMAETWVDPDTNIEWSYSIYNNAQTGYQDTIKIGYGANPAISTDTAGDITIPAEIDGKPIFILADHAFEGCSAITGVTIPDTTKYINSYAFKGCTSLRSIVVPASVFQFGANVFENCASLVYARLLGDVRFGSGYEFKSCASLACFALPTNMSSISYGMFDYCSNLESVAIPKITLRASLIVNRLNVFREVIKTPIFPTHNLSPASCLSIDSQIFPTILIIIPFISFVVNFFA